MLYVFLPLLFTTVLAVKILLSTKENERSHKAKIRTLKQMEKERYKSFQTYHAQMKISEDSAQSIKKSTNDMGQQLVELQKITFNILSKAKTL